MNKQCNRGDMRKIHVTRQFFGASGRHGDFFKKTKNLFLSDHEGRQPPKTAVSRGFSAYILNCLVFSIFLPKCVLSPSGFLFFLFFVRSLNQIKNVRDLKSG